MLHRLVFRSINLAILCVLYPFSSFEVAMAAEWSEIENTSIQLPDVIEGESSSAGHDGSEFRGDHTLANASGAEQQKEFSTLGQTPTSGGAEQQKEMINSLGQHSPPSTGSYEVISYEFEFPTNLTKNLGPSDVPPPAHVT